MSWKQRVNKKGKFPACGVGELPPSIIYVEVNFSKLWHQLHNGSVHKQNNHWEVYGKFLQVVYGKFVHLENLVFILCECLFAENKWRISIYQHLINVRKVNSMDFSSTELQNK